MSASSSRVAKASSAACFQPGERPARRRQRAQRGADRREVQRDVIGIDRHAEPTAEIGIGQPEPRPPVATGRAKRRHPPRETLPVEHL